MSGYDKRVRVGVDADAAVDRAIEKLLELKNTADELDGKKSTITAELKTDTSALDKLQKTTVKIPAIIEATGKSSLSASTKNAIIAQAKQVESIISKAVESGYTTSFQTLPANLYRLNANEIKGVRDGMPKTLAADSDEYKALYKKRYEYSRATKWALAQQENAQPLNPADFTDMAAYIQAVKAQEKLLLTYEQNQKNIKALFGKMKDSIPEDSHITRPGNKNLIGIGKTLESSVEDSKSYIASAFDLDSLQAAIESGSEDMVQAALGGMQSGIDFICDETVKALQKIKADKAFNTTGNKSLSSARNKMLKNISLVTADEASSILKKDFKEVLSGDKSIYDFSTTMLAKLFRNFVVYKNKNGTGLSDKQLENLTAAANNLFEDPENGEYWTEAYSRLEEAIKNPVAETPAIQSKQTSKKNKSGKSNTSSTSSSKKSTPSVSPNNFNNQTDSHSKGSVYDAVVNADYSTKDITDAKKKLELANKTVSDLESNPDVPANSLATLIAQYKARRYYIAALEQGLSTDTLYYDNPFDSDVSDVSDAKSKLKGIEQRLSIYSDIYAKMDEFDSTLLSHHSVKNAADNLALKVMKRNKKHNDGTLTEDDLDAVLATETKLLNKINKKSGKDTTGLYFVPDQKAFYNELDGYVNQESPSTKTITSKSPTTQAQKTEKTADAVDTATDHINNAVASTVGNTTENIDKMTDSAERLGVAVQDTTRTQEDATKQEKLAYKVSRGPKLKAIPATPIASNSSTNSNIPTPPISGNPPLPSVPGTPNFDDMQLLAEKTTSNGQKITKVYKDVNRKVHTLTQTYSQANNTWSATIGTGIKFETLEQDSAKTTAALVSNRQKLYAEMTKPQSQRDFGKIANLKSEIQRLQIQQQEHDSVARAYDQDPTSDYSMAQYRQQVAERMKPNWSKLRDQNNTAVNANKKAYQEEREATQKQKTQSIVGQYTTAVKQAQKLNQVNKEILDIQKQLDDKSNTGIDRTKLQSNLRDLKDQKASLEKTANAFKISDFISKNKTLLESQGKDIDEFDKAIRQAEKSDASIKNYSQQSILKQKTADFTSQYDSAIAKVKELKQAQADLVNVQSEYKINSTDTAVAQRFEEAKKRVSALKTEVESFYKNTYENDKNNNSILNTKKADEYAKAYTSAQAAESKYHKNLVDDMKEQYSLQAKTEKELIGLSTPDKYSQQEHMLLSAAQARAKQSYENMYKEVSQIYGKDYADTQMQDLISQSNINKNNAINSNFSSLSKDIDSFVSKIQNAGRASESFKSQFSSLSSGLDTATTEFKNGSISVDDYVSRMLELRNQTDAYKDYYQNGLGVKDLDYFQMNEKLTKYTNTGDKTGFYQAKLDAFHSRYEELNDTFKNSTKGQKDIEAYSKGIDELVASMEKFGKTSDGLNKTTSKGTMIENTAHQIKDTADASKALTDYAASIGLTNKISQSVNDATGKVTMNFETASGDVVKLTGNIEKANDSLRVMYQNTTKTSTGFSSFSQGLKGLVSGNFKGAIGDIASYVGNIQIMYKAINEMKQGFNTFMDYNKALTTISYTMDMSQSQLQNLGSSAVDMAKDLSMSLDNTMDIYQIYANMNTTSQEIQETAKPTAILSNLSGVDASTAADQVQGILQQFHMLEDGSTSAADASMHVVDVLDKISANVGMDYAKGIKVMTDAVQASGQVAYDAGMSYEQLAAISAKVAERTREDGSSIGNAIKTIITRTTKVGKMPQYSDEVSNEDLSNASASLHAVGVDVYNPDGSDRGIITVLSELKSKWNDLTDAQQAKIAFDVAA